MLFICNSCAYLNSSHSLEDNQFIKELENNKEYFIQVNCRVYDLAGNLVHQFPGGFCYFNDDGSLLMSTNNNQEIGLYDQNLEKKWSHKMHIHHQINKTSDGDYLILTSSTISYIKQKMRFDKFVIINSKGELTKSYDLADHLELVDEAQILYKEFYAPFNWDPVNSNLADYEISHFNSFYEIPENQSSRNFPQLQAHNYIVNNPMCRCSLIFNHQLTNIELVVFIPKTYLTHDSQILTNGNLLIYINSLKGRESFIKQSSIGEYNISNRKFIFEFSPTRDFYSVHSGGVQKVFDKFYFYSDFDHSDPKATFVNSNGEIIKVIRFPNLNGSSGFQQAKLLKLDQFLKNYQGL